MLSDLKRKSLVALCLAIAAISFTGGTLIGMKLSAFEPAKEQRWEPPSEGCTAEMGVDDE